jgi:gamma-glutamyltranspeptidase
LLPLTALPRVTAADPRHTVSDSKGLVVSGRVAATAAGIRMLEQGGNVADAGATTLLALSVT